MNTLPHSAYDRLGGYTQNDIKAGLPKQRKIIQSLTDKELRSTGLDVWKAATDPVFGYANMPLAKLIKEEMQRREINRPRIYPGRPATVVGDEIRHPALGLVKVITVQPAGTVEVEQIRTGKCFRISGLHC